MSHQLTHITTKRVIRTEALVYDEPQAPEPEVSLVWLWWLAGFVLFVVGASYLLLWYEVGVLREMVTELMATRNPSRMSVPPP